jgi:hypothetical protein
VNRDPTMPEQRTNPVVIDEGCVEPGTNPHQADHHRLNGRPRGGGVEEAIDQQYRPAPRLEC